MKYSMILMLTTALLASSKLVVDYTGGQDASVLGNVELEGLDLGCKIINGQAGNAAFIKPEDDSSNGKPSLHLKRDPRFRRAEVKALAKSDNKVKSGKTYFIGYNFRLSALQNGMAVFQWYVLIKPRRDMKEYVLTPPANTGRNGTRLQSRSRTFPSMFM